MDGNVLPLYQFEALDLDKKKAKNIATSLRDKIGPNMVPPVPISGPHESLLMWIMHAQCFVCKYAGYEVTPQSFGAPKGFSADVQNNGFTDYAGLESPFGLDSDIPTSFTAPSRKPLHMPGM